MPDLDGTGLVPSWIQFCLLLKKRVSDVSLVLYQLHHHCFYTCFRTSWAWSKDTVTVCALYSTVQYTEVQGCRHVTVQQTCELTYVIGHANALSHLWKFVTWRVGCRALSVCMCTCIRIYTPIYTHTYTSIKGFLSRCAVAVLITWQVEFRCFWNVLSFVFVLWNVYLLECKADCCWWWGDKNTMGMGLMAFLFFFFGIFSTEDWSAQPATEDWSAAPTAQATEWVGTTTEWS